ncbi:MAG: AAA family ATPase [Planctomycetota bacterium]
MEHIQGQPRALEQLHAQLASGRVHHAQIFYDPPGVGKRTTALAFARVLLCHSPSKSLTGQVAACNQCPSCRLFPSAAAQSETRDPTAEPADANPPVNHPDLHVVTKELARYSDEKQIRDRKLTSIPVHILRSALIEPAYRRAQLNHGKVFVIDEAELLNTAGQNALLKTLEEPPTPDQGGGTTIILATAHEDRLLPTIRSRCQRTAFVPLPDAILDRFLQEHAEHLEPVERSWLVGFAQGSLGRTRLALDYRLTEWAAVVLAQLEQLGRGRAVPSLGSDMADRINAFAEAWVKQHKNASKEAANKLAAGLMFSLVAAHARQQLTRLAQDCDPADPAGAQAAVDPWLTVIATLSTAESRLASNVNLGLVCDGLSAQIAAALRRPLATR